jgi:hypothetical protein
MIESTLRLFKAVQVDDKSAGDLQGFPFERMIKKGYLLDPAIPRFARVLDTVERTVGLSGEQANAAFHKSWSVVRNTPMETLVLQQVVHYVTTYGFERLGIYNQDTVYIPKEALDIPDAKDLPIIVIHALTKDEILAKIIELGSGVALMQETLDDIMVIVMENHYEPSFVQKIKNRELKALLCDLYGIVPTEPTEFLRYMISKLTGESLVIKNKALIDKLKAAPKKTLTELLGKAPRDLASIFLRFKPLFLAMKAASPNKNFFNRLRKASEHLHIPLPADYLNSVTAYIKTRKLDPDQLVEKLKGANMFRKVRLANALQYRLGSTDAIVYRVRNGRGWATTFKWPANVDVRTRQALEIVYESIVSGLRKNVEGKTIYIPGFMHYALPATEKQFSGDFPTGSFVSVSDDTLVGIHWTNPENRRVDLDLSVIGESGKIGWDSRYRSENLSVLFSGDMTNAPPPHGATELFYFSGGVDDPKILMVNYFNFRTDDEVSCDLLVGHEKVTKFDHNYMINPNNILARTKMNINKKQNVLGLVATVQGQTRVYFSNVSVGNSISAGVNDKTMRSRAYLVNSVISSLDLTEFLFLAGAHVVFERPETGDYLDLAPEALNKTTILGLLK